MFVNFYFKLKFICTQNKDDTYLEFSSKQNITSNQILQHDNNELTKKSHFSSHSIFTQNKRFTKATNI